MSKFKILAIFIALFFIAGCGDGSSCDLSSNSRANQNSDNLTKTVDKNVSIPQDSFSSGKVTKETVIPIKNDKNEEVVNAIIPEETEFQDINGTKITEPPKIEVIQEENSNTVQTKLNIIDEKGNKVIPTKPINLKVKAPSGTKAGDEVQVVIPDGAQIIEKMNAEKIVYPTVGKDGFIKIKIEPIVFKKVNIIKIAISKKKKPTTPITGGAGGN